MGVLCPKFAPTQQFKLMKSISSPRYKDKTETLGSLGSNPVSVKHFLEVCDKKKVVCKKGLVTKLLKSKVTVSGGSLLE